MMLWQQPWVWVVAAVALGVLEMLLPGFILLGFAAGALLVAALIWIGLLGPSLPAMLFVLAAGAVPVWLIARRVAGVRAGQSRIVSHDINDT